MAKILLWIFNHRTLALLRWDIYFLSVRAVNFLTGTAGRLRRFTASRSKPTYLNLGSGPRGDSGPQWVNVDGFRDKNVHFRLDFSRRLPFADGTFDGVFCEHVLEHFTLEDGERIMRDVRRCLTHSGTVRLVVPDAETIMRMYFENPDALAARRKTGTAAEAVNSYFRQRYEHQFLCDWPSMEQMLKRAGFSRVEHSVFGRPVSRPALVLDDEKYAAESLYVEAVK